MSVNKSDAKPGISQLVFQRKWLEVKLSYGNLNAEEQAVLIENLEMLDLTIAATSCNTVNDLVLKLERLADLLWPSDDPMPEDCLEHVMLAGLIRDARGLKELS